MNKITKYIFNQEELDAFATILNIKCSTIVCKECPLQSKSGICLKDAIVDTINKTKEVEDAH